MRMQLVPLPAMKPRQPSSRHILAKALPIDILYSLRPWLWTWNRIFNRSSGDTTVLETAPATPPAMNEAATGCEKNSRARTMRDGGVGEDMIAGVCGGGAVRSAGARGRAARLSSDSPCWILSPRGSTFGAAIPHGALRGRRARGRQASWAMPTGAGLEAREREEQRSSIEDARCGASGKREAKEKERGATQEDQRVRRPCKDSSWLPWGSSRPDVWIAALRGPCRPCGD